MKHKENFKIALHPLGLLAITRAEMVAMMAKAMKVNIDMDAQSCSVSGCGGNKFVPNETATKC